MMKHLRLDCKDIELEQDPITNFSRMAVFSKQKETPMTEIPLGFANGLVSDNQKS